MNLVTNFPSFLPSYKHLKKNKDYPIIVEFYHNDDTSEPSLSIIDLASKIFMDDVHGEKIISIQFVGGTDLTFRESIYNSNLSNNDVVFSSKFDDETYCIISFSEKE